MFHKLDVRKLWHSNTNVMSLSASGWNNFLWEDTNRELLWKHLVTNNVKLWFESFAQRHLIFSKKIIIIRWTMYRNFHLSIVLVWESVIGLRLEEMSCLIVGWLISSPQAILGIMVVCDVSLTCRYAGDNEEEQQCPLVPYSMEFRLLLRSTEGIFLIMIRAWMMVQWKVELR